MNILELMNPTKKIPIETNEPYNPPTSPRNVKISVTFRSYESYDLSDLK